MGAYLSLSGSGSGGEVGWGGGVLIRGWALRNFFCLQDGRLFEMGAFSNKYGIQLLKVAKFYTKQTSVNFRNLLAKDHFTNSKAPFSMVSTDFP